MKSDTFSVNKKEDDGKIACHASVTYKGEEHRSQDRNPTYRQFERHAVRACLTKSSAKKLLRKLK